MKGVTNSSGLDGVESARHSTLLCILIDCVFGHLDRSCCRTRPAHPFDVGIDGKLGIVEYLSLSQIWREW